MFDIIVALRNEMNGRLKGTIKDEVLKSLYVVFLGFKKSNPKLKLGKSSNMSMSISAS